MLVGSFASTSHGAPRATQDIDIVIDPTPAALDRFVAALDPDRIYVEPSAARRALADRDQFNVIETTTSWKVDLIIRKERPFSISIQALLYQARRLGRLSDVSHRNAMMTISSRGWRRDEPGLISACEQPSLLPRALELLAREGIGEDKLLEQCRIPSDLFHTVTARTPAIRSADPSAPAKDGNGTSRPVLSLLERRQRV